MGNFPVNREKAIAFLSKNQPLPNDTDISEDDLDQYRQLIHFLGEDENKDPTFIPLLIGSFGDGGGYGLYDSMSHILNDFDSEKVVPQIIVGLSSKHWGVRFWSARISVSYHDDALIEPLGKLITEPDEDIKTMTVLALYFIKSPRVADLFREALKTEQDQEIRAEMTEYLQVESSSFQPGQINPDGVSQVN